MNILNIRLIIKLTKAVSFICLTGISFVSLTNAQPQCRENDSLELVKFYNNFNGNEWTINLNWLVPGKPINEWYGVELKSDCVSLIVLPNNNLSGNLYDFIFPELLILDLSGNRIFGDINNFLDIPNLQYLWLSKNKLTGQIPDFSHISNLKLLALENNQLSGFIPDFSNLPNLSALELRHNNLSSQIPDFLNIPSLEYLWISFNYLSGSIPNFSNIDGLLLLEAAFNQIEDSIPDFSNIPNLSLLDISNNKLKGSIPDFSNINNLKVLSLFNNNLTGSIPELLGLPNLIELNLNNNRLEGTIPNFSNLSKLASLELSNNEITGSVTNLSILDSLSILNLSNNLLLGHIQSLYNLPNLKELNFAENKFTFSDFLPFKNGINYIYSPQEDFYIDTTSYSKSDETLILNLLIDSSLLDNNYSWLKNDTLWSPPNPNSSNSNKLIFSSISLNDFGRYKVSVTNPSAPDLQLNSKTISVKVCNSVNDSIELTKFYNALDGPNWTDNLNWLNLTKPISSWYGISTDKLGCVNGITLPNNNLKGKIPDLNMNTLDSLILNQNQITSNIPNLETPFIKKINYAHNQLSKTIPNKLLTYFDLQFLNLEFNNLTEIIPPDLGDLCELQELMLNNNMFHGELPEELTKLQNLKIGKVDFSNNLIDTLKDKIIFFCPFGDSIFEKNPSYDRFLGICNVRCSGLEWDSLIKYHWLRDTLLNLNCNDSIYCIKTSIQAGYVDVRDIKIIFIRTRCFKDTILSIYTERVTFYDCSGNVIETAHCLPNQFCTSFGAINTDQLNLFKYDFKWNCGDTFGIITNLIESNSKNNSNLTLSRNILQCYPNPGIDFLICNQIIEDTFLELQFIDLNGKTYNVPFTIQNQNLHISVEELKSGIYFVLLKGKKAVYKMKLIII